MPSPFFQSPQVPGVYVTQSGTSLNAINPTALNIAIIADQPTLSSATNTFANVVAASGATIGQLSTPMVVTTGTGTYSNYSGFTVTWVSGSTTVTGTYGVNFNINTASGSPYSYLTTSGVTASTTSALPSGTVNITYGHQWGAYGTYYTFNQVAAAIGSAVSGTTVVNPAVLAAQLAYQNGANTVSILPVARVSSSGQLSATTSDWSRVFNTNVSGTGSDQTYLANFNAIDVVVPLYGFISNNQPATSAVTSGVNNYLTSQANIGIYQRAFIGVDGTAGQVSVTNLQNLSLSGFGNSRVSLVYPTQINYNPGLNVNTGYANVNFNIPGYYVAAAIAGTFVGQTSVATPITNKIVNGFNAIPNQISLNDASTNYLPYGITTLFQKRDGNFYVLQGLTTNTTNWLTQEISINAIGDQLANNIYKDLNSSFLVGGPLTQNTLGAAVGTVQNSLINAVQQGLIQSYQNVTYQTNPSLPTEVQISFQYAPTYPINYIQITMSLNSQTGTVIVNNQQTNLVVY